jgi:hypothetical protein
MAKNAHLTLSERIIIETCLRDAMSFKQIAQEVGKDPSTISKEIRGHFKVLEKIPIIPAVTAENASIFQISVVPANISSASSAANAAKSSAIPTVRTLRKWYA